MPFTCAGQRVALLLLWERLLASAQARSEAAATEMMAAFYELTGPAPRAKNGDAMALLSESQATR